MCRLLQIAVRCIPFILLLFPSINIEVVHDTRSTSTHKVFETPLLWFLWVVLPDATVFCLGRYDLFVDRVDFFWGYKNTILPDTFYNGFDLEELASNLLVICGIINEVNEASELLVAFYWHDICHGRVPHFLGPIQFVGGQPDNAHFQLQTINCSISSLFVVIEDPFFCVLYKLVWSTTMSFNSSVQNSMK